MNKEKINLSSYLLSFAFHLVITLLFLLFHFSPNAIDEDYVIIGFGTDSGIPSAMPPQNQVQKSDEEEKMELPAVKNPFDNESVFSEKKKNDEKSRWDEVLKDEKQSLVSEYYGDGSAGYNIDFGAGGVRKIYSFIIPPYPEGVEKEIDVKLRFTIMPDGSVGRIFPLIKADSRLEESAITALRQWRFEPQSPAKKQSEQTATIIFPFRLR